MRIRFATALDSHSFVFRTDEEKKKTDDPSKAVECELCLKRFHNKLGHLFGSPGRSGFAQHRFVCFQCRVAIKL